MTEMTAALIGAVGGWLAFGVAWRAPSFAKKTFHRDHRPLVRVVTKYEPTVFVVGGPRYPDTDVDMGPRVLLTQVTLKNIGRRPALSVVGYDANAAWCFARSRR